MGILAVVGFTEVLHGKHLALSPTRWGEKPECLHPDLPPFFCLHFNIHSTYFYLFLYGKETIPERVSRKESWLLGILWNSLRSSWRREELTFALLEAWSVSHLKKSCPQCFLFFLLRVQGSGVKQFPWAVSSLVPQG